jgi:tRNA (cytidine/uridine-2'-O-)-methyltransferase
MRDGRRGQAAGPGGAPALRLALFEPDRPHNLGGALRLCACFGLAVDVVGPCGFPLDERRVREAGLDYHRHVRLAHHPDLAAFERDVLLAGPRRLVLLSTRGAHAYHEVAYEEDDVLMVGRESAGVPEMVHRRADLSVRVPLRPGLRSLNVVAAAAIVAAEALRQTGGLHEAGDPGAADATREGDR